MNCDISSQNSSVKCRQSNRGVNREDDELKDKDKETDSSTMWGDIFPADAADVLSVWASRAPVE